MATIPWTTTAPYLAYTSTSSRLLKTSVLWAYLNFTSNMASIQTIRIIWIESVLLVEKKIMMMMVAKLTTTTILNTAMMIEGFQCHYKRLRMMKNDWNFVVTVNGGTNMMMKTKTKTISLVAIWQIVLRQNQYTLHRRHYYYNAVFIGALLLPVGYSKLNQYLCIAVTICNTGTITATCTRIIICFETKLGVKWEFTASSHRARKFMVDLLLIFIYHEWQWIPVRWMVFGVSGPYSFDVCMLWDTIWNYRYKGTTGYTKWE